MGARTHRSVGAHSSRVWCAIAALAALSGCHVYDADLVLRRDVVGETVAVDVNLRIDTPAPIDTPSNPLDATDAAVPDAATEVSTDVPADTGCLPGQERCGANCVEIRTDPMNCGTCGTACADGPNQTATCVGGVCRYACDPEFGDCDADPSNGCEIQLTTDTMHCGTCPTACAGGTNAMATCEMGVCRLRCLSGFDDCDGNATTGCEASLDSPRSCGMCGISCPASQPLCSVTGGVGMCTTGCPAGQSRCGTSCVDTATDPNNCGACGTRCAPGTNATATCSAGACGIACVSGFGNCNSVSTDGCETSLTTTSNCGACAMRCPFGAAFTTPVCTAARTCSTTCQAGRGDCDANPANGCEAALTVPTSCGACTTRCTSTQACAGGGCCPIGTTRCGTSTACVNINSDPMNCGACGTLCPSTTPSCCNGRCTATATCTGRYTMAPLAIPTFVNVCAAASHRTVLTLTDDGSITIPQTTGTPLITLPFAVRFYGLSAPVPFTVSSNGWLSLASTTSASLGGTIPSTSLPNALLSPYWDDVYTRAAGICYGVSGASPSRRFGIQWQDLHYCCTDDPLVHLTFEVLINEAPLGGNNTFDFIYQRLDGNRGRATVGVENQAGTVGTQVPGTFTAPVGFRFTYVP